MDVAGDNPFSTRFVRPGAAAFLFPEHESADQLVRRLAANGWRGEIVGPHGAGKSTLVQSLLPALRAAGRTPHFIQLHAGDSRLPHGRAALTALPPSAVIVIDGYEQLSFWVRFRLKRVARRRGLGLLVTSHEPTGLPTLYRFEPNVCVAQAIVRQLLTNHPHADSITASDVREAFAACGGNLRETLFRLYDVYEQRRPSSL